MNEDWKFLIDNETDIISMMSRLPPADRALIILVDCGLDRLEIATLVGSLANKNITVDAIHQHAHRMRENIIRILQEEKEKKK